MADVPLLVKSDFSSSERRVTPSWTISKLKTKLETITGVPAGCQRLTLHVGQGNQVAIEAADEDSVFVSTFPIRPYIELEVRKTRPALGICSCSHEQSHLTTIPGR